MHGSGTWELGQTQMDIDRRSDLIQTKSAERSRTWINGQAAGCVEPAANRRLIGDILRLEPVEATHLVRMTNS